MVAAWGFHKRIIIENSVIVMLKKIRGGGRGHDSKFGMFCHVLRVRSGKHPFNNDTLQHSSIYPPPLEKRGLLS
jgi:hypothetical protein